MTDGEGHYLMRGMPSGEYTVTAWHAQSREKTDDMARSLRLAGAMSSLTSSSRSTISAAARPSTEPGPIHEWVGA